MGIYVADIETTGLLDDLRQQENPLIHNMGLWCAKTGQEILFSRGADSLEETPVDDVRPIEQLQGFLDQGHTIIGHNFITYDGEALVMLGYDTSKLKYVDTLAISWFLHPKLKRHGLATWGEHYGIPKPVIEDWENQPQEVYNHRVIEDVRINARLWKDQDAALVALYGYTPAGKAKKKEFIQYLMWKMHQQRIQQNNRWKLDEDKATKLQDKLEADKAVRFEALMQVMPKIPKKVVKTRPVKCFKKNGALSANGIKWASLCKAAKKDFETFNGGITVIKERVEGNPNAPMQVKEWLYSLGWIPETFEIKRDKETGEVREIPQINVKNTGGAVCPSIDKLIDRYPEAGLEHLVGLGIIKHRIGVVKGFLRDVTEDGTLLARCNGFTNTLRLKHAELVNLPSSRVPYGEDLRAMLHVEEGYLNLGADLSSLEDRVKHHFQLPLDPLYVATQMKDDYDPHMYIAVLGGIMTQGMYDSHILYEATDGKSGKKYSRERNFGKATNYSCQYGAGAATVARSAGCSLEVGKTLHATYWAANWSIKEIAKQQKVKEVAGVKYQLNPINGFWYWLKAEKDRFSTLCQGTGAYVFDVWVGKVNEVSLERYGKECPLVAQFHDELILKVRDTEKSRNAWKSVMEEAMKRTNEVLNMRREMASDVQFGTNYSEIH